jgi:multisubunit Na+/H+ antiporter MnhB subunit
VNPGRAFAAGVVGTVLMSLIMIVFRATGTPIHVELRLGATLGTQMWLVGFIMYLLIGGVFAVGYAAVFEYVLNQAGIGPGLLMGAYHTIFAGFFWATVAGPGPFWDSFGPEGIALLFLLHFTYGAVVGALYRNQHVLAYV